MKFARSDLHVRTLRVATGAHFLSFVTGSDASGPTLTEELGRLPPWADLVINVDGLDIDGALAVAAVLGESDHLRESSGRIILVCEEASIRRVFELLRLDQQVLIEHSLDDAFRDVISRALLRESA